MLAITLLEIWLSDIVLMKLEIYLAKLAEQSDSAHFKAYIISVLCFVGSLVGVKFNFGCF